MMPDDTARRCNYRKYKKAVVSRGGAVTRMIEHNL